MRRFTAIVSCILFCLITLIPVRSQDFITDTVPVQFGDSVAYALAFSCDSISDSRKIGAEVLSVAQGKKYLIKYYDIFYTTPETLSKEIEDAFIWEHSGRHIALDIERFEVKGFSKKNTNGTYLYSQVTVSERVDSGSVYLGTMVHELNWASTFPFPADSLPPGPPVEAWKSLFAEDMNDLSRGKEPGNFYRQELRPHFIPRTLVHVGLKSMIVDGEFWFTNPEASRSFTEASYKLRYRNAQDFESLGFPIVNSSSYYRLNDHFMLLSNYSGFFGINRWKESVDRKLGFQDILHLNASASQGIILQAKHGRGFVAGIGITEDLVYIYEQKLMFQPAVFFLLGIKL